MDRNEGKILLNFCTYVKHVSSAKSWSQGPTTLATLKIFFLSVRKYKFFNIPQYWCYTSLVDLGSLDARKPSCSLE